MSHHENDRSIATAEWVWDNLERFQSDEPDYRLLEVDEDPDAYDEWHVPGAVDVDWGEDIGGDLGSELVEKAEFEALLGGLGITEDTTVVLYGDSGNWFAAHAYWVVSYYGHEDVRLMNGGRHYWSANDYPTTDEVPSFSPREYVAAETRAGGRAFEDDVMAARTVAEGLRRVPRSLQHHLVGGTAESASPS